MPGIYYVHLTKRKMNLEKRGKKHFYDCKRNKELKDDVCRAPQISKSKKRNTLCTFRIQNDCIFSPDILFSFFFCFNFYRSHFILRQWTNKKFHSLFWFHFKHYLIVDSDRVGALRLFLKIFEFTVTSNEIKP